MSLKNWEINGWLRPHKTSADEIKNLFEIVDRDMKDSCGDISADWQFGIAYNAALKLCSILLFASGYRPEKSLAHYRTIQALPLILGEKSAENADYLNSCRIKRNETEYEFAGGITARDAEELVGFVKELKSSVLDFLTKNHSNLCPSESKGKK